MSSDLAPAAKKQRRSQHGPTRLPWSSLVEFPSRFADLIEKHHYVVLTDMPDHISRACDDASEAMKDFFLCTEPEAKQTCVCTEPSWRCGYRVTSRSEGISGGCRRESYQVRGDTGGRQPWPSRKVAAVSAHCALQLEAVAQRCLVAALRGARPPSMLDVDDMNLGPSVLDAFHYLSAVDETALQREKGAALMYEHYDPGFLTLEPCASAPGLEVLDGDTGEWRLVELEVGAGELLVFANETLHRITGGLIERALHRVVDVAEGPRHVIAYELRSLRPSLFSIDGETLT